MMNLDQVKAVFLASGVTTALLVDDIFDPTEDYGAEDLDRGFALFESTDSLDAAFVALGGTRPINPDDLRRQLEQVHGLETALKTARTGDTTPLQALANAVFGVVAEDQAAQLKPLEDLRKLLADLGVQSTPVGSNGPGPEANRYPLIFMDYYLGAKGAPSAKKSRDRIMEIVSHYGPHEKPIVILMSSDMNKDRVALEFRDEAELLGCQFKFVTKSQFEDDNFEFVSSLADLVQFLPQTRTIGSFVTAWKEALISATEDFKKDIGKLDLQDYFQIKSKMGDGGVRRFGDHMSGLFDGYLRRLVEDRPGLRSANAALNSISLDNRPPSPFAPSSIVTKMANASAFQSLPEPIGDESVLDLELGDIYIREFGKSTARKIEAAVVISQACDLEHGKTDTVLLIKGIVTKRSAKITRNPANRPIIRTDLFLYDEKELIIDWDAGDIISHSVAGFAEWAKNDMVFEKVARLRPMQALALQQRYAAHLTRVGLPDALPPYRYPAIQVFYLKNGKKEALFDKPIPRKDELACVIGEEKREVVLQDRLFTRIRTTLEVLDVATLEGDKFNAVVAALNDFDKLRALRNQSLSDSVAQIGEIALMDTEKILGAGDNLPKKAWLAINLISSD